MAERVLVAAPAKVNLRLKVLARNDDGFHFLESVFCALSLADEVEIRRGAAGVALKVEGEDTGPAGKNLAVLAARAFYRKVGREPSVGVRLAKRVPASAGLGGGSSNAAAVLRGLNELEGWPLAPESLARVGGALGSDVPFFLCGSPLALGWGRGDRLLPLPPLPPRPVLVVKPEATISTARAYTRLAASRAGDPVPSAGIIPARALGSWEGVSSLSENDFEPVAAEEFPEIGEVLRRLREAGAGIARLAGSGSACFGVFESRQRRDAAAGSFARGEPLRVWKAETLANFSAPRIDGTPSCG
ncbi:MAG: 4-(cytidine 5'-diphospho)-2-C-methyl-D-erythritol kinase [Longimicrobiaceae bacterium]